MIEKPYSPGIQILLLFGLTLTLGLLSQVFFGVLLVALYPDGPDHILLESPWVLLSGAFFSSSLHTSPLFFFFCVSLA